MSEKSLWKFDLYVSGQTPKSQRVFSTLKSICDEYIAGQCTIKVSDIQKNPQTAIDNQITAIPTVIRRSPLPERILIGDLTNTERVTTKLELNKLWLHAKC